MSDLFDVPVRGAYHLVCWLDSVSRPFLGQSATACAIVLCTVCVRLLLLPLSRAAVRGERARAAMMPRLTELQRRHAGDPGRLRRELADLQRDTGTTVFAGCLPMLAQLPFFWVLYRLFSMSLVAGQPNSLLAGNLFGLTLGTHWPVLTASPVFFALAAALAVVAWFSSRWQARHTPVDAPGGRWLRLLPYASVLTAAIIPPATGLYLLTTTTWTVIERALLRRDPT
jgi:YidC/Oxa1 family membrane protein insertase